MNIEITLDGIKYQTTGKLIPKGTPINSLLPEFKNTNIALFPVMVIEDGKEVVKLEILKAI